jgi:hypothetical protein
MAHLDIARVAARYHPAAIVVGQYVVREYSDNAGRRAAIAAYVRSVEDTFRGRARGTSLWKLSCCSSLLQHCIAYKKDATLLTQISVMSPSSIRPMTPPAAAP